jgi:hypothetical protein
MQFGAVWGGVCGVCMCKMLYNIPYTLPLLCSFMFFYVLLCSFYVVVMLFMIVLFPYVLS